MTADGRALTSEFIGTAMLLAAIVGSGWAVEELGAAPAVELFIHASAVGVVLAVLVAVFLPLSGSQFNPVVTAALMRRGAVSRQSGAAFISVQIAGAMVGTVLANLSFAGELGAVATGRRDGAGLLVAEVFATFGLVFIILVLIDTDRSHLLPLGVGGWVAGVIVATASTGFANPAVTFARMFTDSFTGIHPLSAPAFIAAQIVGAGLAVVTASRLRSTSERAHV